jgi:hypothetical protein
LDNLLINFESEEDKKNLNMLKAEVKIIDFGFATYLDNTGLRYSILGSPINMDPVLLTKLINQNVSNSIGYTEKADIWSLGTVCYELITGRAIFHAQNVIDLIRLVEEGNYFLPTDLSQEIVSFLNSMLQYSSNNRLSAVELSNHPFLTKNVNEFTKLDLIKLSNRIDQRGLVINIKKNPDTDKPSFDVQARINYYQQQQYYKNIRNNNNNFIYPTGYNYYANTGPKYYMANLNPQYRQIQANPQPGFTQGIITNPLMNQYNNNNLKQNYTFQEQKNNNNLQYKIKYPNTNYNLYKNQKSKDAALSNDLNEIYPKELRKNVKDQTKDYLQYKNGLNGLNHQISQDNKNNIGGYGIYSNKPPSNQIPYQYNQNSTGVPQISDTINPSPVPFSGPIRVKNRMENIPFSGMEGEINLTPNPFYGKSHHMKKKSNNRSMDEYRENNYKKYTNNDTKEITSEALDGLFDFNIGKELEPEPEFTIEK